MRCVATKSLPLILLAGILASFLQATEPDPEYRWRILPNIGQDTVNLTLTRRVGFNTSTHTTSVPFSSLRGLEPSDFYGGTVSFHIRADAGTFHFKGSFALGAGFGSMTFDADPYFLKQLKEIGFHNVQEDQLIDLAMDNFRLSTARDLRAACNCVETVDDVIQLNNHGVDARYLRNVTQLSSPPLSVEQITEMKDHGVQISLLEVLRNSGYQLPARSVIELQDHGVGKSFIRELGPYSKGAFSGEELIALHDHGVSPEFVRQLREPGGNASANEIIRLHDHGADVRLVHSVKEAGVNGSITSAIALHDHGVDAQYVHDMSATLRAKITTNDLIQLHDHGVSSEFAQHVAESGFEVQDPEKLISLHERGIPTDLLAQTRSHRVKFTVEEIIRLHDHGIDADFLRSFDTAGYVDASADDLIQLHDHGVTADFARRMQSEGFSGLRVTQLVKLKDHGL